MENVELLFILATSIYLVVTAFSFVKMLKEVSVNEPKVAPHKPLKPLGFKFNQEYIPSTESPVFIKFNSKGSISSECAALFERRKPVFYGLQGFKVEIIEMPMVMDKADGSIDFYGNTSSDSLYKGLTFIDVIKSDIQK